MNILAGFSPLFLKNSSLTHITPKKPIHLDFTETLFNQQQNLSNLSHGYLGRGIVQGLATDGQHALQVYWLMGRSPSSKARRLIIEKNKLLIQATGKAELKNPELLLYTAMNSCKKHWIVSNGQHTELLVQAAQKNTHPLTAIYTLQPEPDEHLTPRIAAGITPEKSCWLAIVQQGKHRTFTYPLQPQSAFGIHTYQPPTTQPLTPFSKLPLPLPLLNPQETANSYWQHLNPKTRIALAVRSINLEKQTCQFYLPTDTQP